MWFLPVTRSVTPFLNDAPPPKKIPGSASDHFNIAKPTATVVYSLKYSQNGSIQPLHFNAVLYRRDL